MTTRYLPRAGAVEACGGGREHALIRHTVRWLHRRALDAAARRCLGRHRHFTTLKSIDDICLHALREGECYGDAHRDKKTRQAEEGGSACDELRLVLRTGEVGPMAGDLIVAKDAGRDRGTKESELNHAIAYNACHTRILDPLQYLLRLIALGRVVLSCYAAGSFSFSWHYPAIELVVKQRRIKEACRR